MAEEVDYSNSDNAKIVHFRCMRGDSFDRELIFRTNEVDDNITNDIFRLHVRNPQNDKIVLSFEMGKGATIADNKLVLAKTPLEMHSVQPGTYKYDLEQKYGATGKVRTRIKGIFIVSPDESH